MNDEHKQIFLNIRELTKKIRVENATMLRLINNNTNFFSDLPQLKQLRDHLELWLEKYNKKIDSLQTALIYEEGKPFPTNIENIVERKINELKGKDIAAVENTTESKNNKSFDFGPFSQHLLLDRPPS